VIGRTFVDTNIWVYTVDDGEPDKQIRAREVVAPGSNADLVVSAQVLGEFYVTVRRKFAIAVSDEQAAALVDRLRRLPVVAIDADLVSAGIANAHSWQLSYWDALIVTAAQLSECEMVMSEDLAHGRTYGSIRIENPFL